MIRRDFLGHIPWPYSEIYNPSLILRCTVAG